MGSKLGASLVVNDKANPFPSDIRRAVQAHTKRKAFPIGLPLELDDIPRKPVHILLPLPHEQAGFEFAAFPRRICAIL
jgi:hypothetical protein